MATEEAGKAREAMAFSRIEKAFEKMCSWLSRAEDGNVEEPGAMLFRAPALSCRELRSNGL
jgi:hypothetical protein